MGNTIRGLNKAFASMERLLGPVAVVLSLTTFLESVSASSSFGASAQVPTLGWNSWYALGKASGWPLTNESVILDTARALVATGLRDAGYNTIVIDDSWEATTRNSPPNDGLQADREKFPRGMKFVVDYLHKLNLITGLYTVPGNFTCSGEIEENHGMRGALGSFGHIQADIDLWVGEWGVGYVKNCVCNTTATLRSHAYIDMKRAIEKYPNHSVTYECANFMDEPWAANEAKDRTCNIWSVSDDVPDSFEEWTAGVDKAVIDRVNRYAGPSPAGGGWSSFDYIQVGGKQTYDEYRSQISMFAILAAPIFIGTDVRSISTIDLAVYLAPEILAIHQDPLGRPGHRIEHNTSRSYDVWSRELSSNATCALFVLNRAPSKQCVRLILANFDCLVNSGTNKFILRDAWAKEDIKGVFTIDDGAISLSIETHACKLLVARPA